MKSPRLDTLRSHRGALYVALGGALVGAPLTLAGCTDAPATEQAAAQKNAVTLIREVEAGRYVIEDEQVTDGPGRVVIRHLDGRVETISDPETFAEKLPKEPPRPDSVAARTAVASAGHGFGLGDVLLFSMLMNAWRPAYYPSAYHYNPPSRAFATPDLYRRSTSVLRPQFRRYQSQGLAPTGAASVRRTTTPGRVQTAPRSRATSPSAGRSGYFGRSGGSSGSRGFTG